MGSPHALLGLAVSSVILGLAASSRAQEPSQPHEAGASYVDWEDGQPVPAGWRRTTRPRTSLLATGAVTFGVAHALAFVAAVAPTPCSAGSSFDSGGVQSSTCGRPRWLLVIPLAGPFAELGHVSSHATTAQALLVTDGLLQSGGVALAVLSFVYPSAVLEQQRVARPAIVPWFGGTSGGLRATF